MTPASDALRALTASMHAQIPMTAFLGIALIELTDDRASLAAPLGPARNHRGSAFGPGVFTAAGLAPWLLLVRRAWAARLPVQILLARAEIRLHRPISCDFRARCEDLPALDVPALRRGERQRLAATAHVFVDDGRPAATYLADFAILAAEPAGREGDLSLPFPEAWR